MKSECEAFGGIIFTCKKKIEEESQHQYHSIHHKCHMTPPRMPDHQRGKPEPNHMRYGIAK
jgi:hypothetical protein